MNIFWSGSADILIYKRVVKSTLLLKMEASFI